MEQKKIQETIYLLATSSMRKEDLEEIFQEIRCEHRTHQQSFMRFVIKFLRDYAENADFDGRNEAAVTFAKEVCKLIDENRINDGLPFI